MSPLLVIYLLAAHYVADWLCQSEKQALGKSKSLYLLTEHVAVYTAVMGLLFWHPLFVGLNGVIHWGVDYLTSRLNARLWAAKDRRFWWSLGADQLAHQVTLLLTAWWLLS